MIGCRAFGDVGLRLFFGQLLPHKGVVGEGGDNLFLLTHGDGIPVADCRVGANDLVGGVARVGRDDRCGKSRCKAANENGGARRVAVVDASRRYRALRQHSSGTGGGEEDLAKHCSGLLSKSR